MIQGLRTIIYDVAYLDRATEWYASLLSRHPYFDELFYVSFDADGYKPSLQPVEPGSPCLEGGVAAYGAGA